jgi:hypothetical protein
MVRNLVETNVVGQALPWHAVASAEAATCWHFAPLFRISNLSSYRSLITYSSRRSVGVGGSLVTISLTAAVWDVANKGLNEGLTKLLVTLKNEKASINRQRIEHGMEAKFGKLPSKDLPKGSGL